MLGLNGHQGLLLQLCLFLLELCGMRLKEPIFGYSIFSFLLPETNGMKILNTIEEANEEYEKPSRRRWTLLEDLFLLF